MTAMMLYGCISFINDYIYCFDDDYDDDYEEEYWDDYAWEDLDYDIYNDPVKCAVNPDILKPISVYQYADRNAIEHAQDTDSMEELQWLVDYCVNKIEPQAVEMLLSIPVFKNAAKNNLISKYTTFGITYDEDGAFEAMTEASYHNKKGELITGDENDSSYGGCYNLGHRIIINTDTFNENIKNDPDMRRELKDTFLHEMTHAFMDDYVRNAMNCLLKDGKFEEDCSLPIWFTEGTAITVENGYASTRYSFLNKFNIDKDDPMEDRVEYLTNPEDMFERLKENSIWTYEDDNDDYIEFYDNKNNLMSDITVECNEYVMSYYVSMFTYYMAAKTMGLEPFNENDVLDMEAMRLGFGYILDELHDGHSFDEIIATISKDPYTGISAYNDSFDIEKKFMYSKDDPGMAFVQKLAYDFETRIVDDTEYIPGGSIIPGVNNYVEDFMDDEYHPSPSFFDIVYYDKATPDDQWYAISTVRPSETVKGGNCCISYFDDNEMTEAEIEDRDRLYIGDEIRLFNYNGADYYKSSDEWMTIACDSCGLRGH